MGVGVVGIGQGYTWLGFLLAAMGCGGIGLAWHTEGDE